MLNLKRNKQRKAILETGVAFLIEDTRHSNYGLLEFRDFACCPSCVCRELKDQILRRKDGDHDAVRGRVQDRSRL